MYWLLLWLLLQVLWLKQQHSQVDSSEFSYSKGGARRRFEEKFLNSCSKYPFVDRYLDQMRNPRDNYLIFVFHENGQKVHGGLGDRLAGMVTAIAYAIRSNRTFLVMGDGAFEQSFRPFYSPVSISTSTVNTTTIIHATTITNTNKVVSVEEAALHAGEGLYGWDDWKWAKWQREYSANMSTLHCVNPHWRSSHCALDDRKAFAQYKVIKYYGNRCYLCRWMMKREEHGNLKELRRILRITESADLYEIAGCLLRLAVWPTEKLWTALDESLQQQFASHQSAVTTRQVGFHFRCGDSSFSASKHRGFSVPNPQCFFDPEVPWKGTSFSDDWSLDSPVDAAKCGQQLLRKIAAEQQTQQQQQQQGDAEESVLAYIASDNGDSAQQINDTLQWPFAIKPPQACHMDLQKTGHCTLITSLHWFMLSLSDHIVMQALIKPAVDSPYEDLPSAKQYVLHEQQAPVSAFSRYAAIYSLSPSALRYGSSCSEVNRTALSHQTQGNWVCNPKMFY